MGMLGNEGKNEKGEEKGGQGGTTGGRAGAASSTQTEWGRTAAGEEMTANEPKMLIRNASGGERAEMRELFLRMDPGMRVSRSVRAEWLLDHLNCPVDLAAERSAKQKGLSLFGFVPGPARLAKEERFRVGPNTSITFLADCYRIAFVLDLSPSSFVIDDLGCVLYTRLIQNLIKCLQSVVSKASIPGSQSEFRPRICVSVCAFSPFLCFPEENILIHGVLLSPETIDPIVSQLLDRLKMFIDRLVLFSQPHMREWSSERRRNRRGRGAPQNGVPPPKSRAVGTDRGFIQSDWALIFMLRMGLMGVQMMGQAGRSLANIVLVSDGVCGVLDQQALQGALGQLRLNAVSCSFVQLPAGSLRGPVLGHVGFPELFNFIANATFGSFLPESDLEGPKGADGLNPVQRALLTWSFRRGIGGGGPIWTGKGDSPQMAEGGQPQFRTNHIRNKCISRTYETMLGRLMAIRLREGFSVRQIEEMQGVGAKGGELDDLAQQQQPNLLVRLSLAWRPQINIEYCIWGPKSRIGQRKAKFHVDIFVEANLHSPMANLLGERQDPSSLRSALIGLNEGDALLMHLNSFNSETHYWELPKEVDRSVAIFEFKRATQRLALAERYEALHNSKFISYWQPLSNIDEGLWQKWMHTHAIRLILAHDQPLPERIFTPQSKGRFVQCTAEMAFNELHNHLRRWASFALVKEQIYVCLIHEEPNESRAKKSSGMKAPDQFCLIRTSLDIPCVLIRLCFPPGVAGQTRDEVLGQFRESLGKLRIVRESQTLLLNEEERRESQCWEGQNNRQFQCKTTEVPSVHLVQKPFERVLVRYREMPQNLDQIVRLKWTESVQESAQMILHNAVSKFMACKRQVWRMRGIFLKNVVPGLAAVEFILQTLLRLRLHQGFKLAWSKNGIVNLIRQVPAQKVNSDGQQPILEQCVIFGPTMAESQSSERLAAMVAGNGPPRQRKSSLCGGEEEKETSNEKFGTMEWTKCTQIGGSGCFWPQIVTEIWSEPIKQQSGAEAENGVEKSRKALLAENGLLIHTFFTFDQLMAVCNSRLWAEKPFLMGQIGAEEVNNPLPDLDNSAVQFLNGAFDLGALLRNATQRELMLLPAMGYAESDPHSLTRLSFLLKGLQQELTEFCDFCMELADDEFFGGILAELENCLGIQEHWNEMEGGMEEEEREQAIEAELEQLWRLNLPQEKEPPPERLTLPARPPPASSPPSPLPLGRHFSTGQHIYPYSYQTHKEASSIPNSPTPKSALKTTFVLPERGEEKEGKGSSRNLFSESADARMRKKQTKEQQQQQSRLMAEQQQQALLLFSASQRSTSVPLLWASGGQMKAKMGSSNKKAKETVGMQRKLQQKRASIGGQKSAKMMETLGIEEEPKKKLSAPLPQNHGLLHQSKNSICSPRDSSTQQRCQQIQMQKTLRVYAKRLNDWRMVIFVMAKDARVCRNLMGRTVQNTFPVMAFFCDKPRMAQHFVENMADGLLRPPEPWIVENFGLKLELSTLANLQRQIQRRENLGERRGAGELDSFYLVGCYAAANAGLIEMDPGELGSHYWPQFDLVDHCENVFEEFLFTKAFIGTIYTCLGQQLFVPVPVLTEALDYRCEHTNIEIGPINDILRDTCSHLGEGQGTIRLRKRPRSSSSTNSSSSSSSSYASPSKRFRGLGVSSSMGRSSGEDTLVMADQNEPKSPPLVGPQDCGDQLDDFRSAFDQLLRRHNFHRIPGLPDYFFYWPQQQEHSLSSFNLPGLEDYIQITLPTEFSPPQSAHFSQTEPKSGAFSRHSSARNTGKEKRTRKASASAGSIAGGKKQNSTEMMQRRETEEQTEMGSIQSRCSGSSSTSWEQRDEEDEADSEKSSLAGELLSEHWPLFIQFHVAIQQLPSGQQENSPIEFIPNCLKQIFGGHSSNLQRVNLGARGRCFRMGQLKISIDMYVLTWPLPSHCPYGEQQSGEEDSGTTERGGPVEEERGNAGELEELFGGSEGAEWVRRRTGRGMESGDEIFERKVEMLRQIPTEERRMLRRLQRNVQKMLKTEHVLITSRAFGSRQDFGTLLRVVQFIREEVDGRGAANARTGTEQTVARFEMCQKELVFVTEPEEGLGRLAAKLEGICVEYCRLRELPKGGSAVPFELESLVDSTKMLFFSCGVENLDNFARTRHESIKQIGTAFKRALSGQNEQQKRKMGGQEEGDEEEGINCEGGRLIEEEEEGEEGDEGERELGNNSSTTAEEGGTIAELTMPLNDLDLECGILHPNDLTLRQIAVDAEENDEMVVGKGRLIERKQLLHDFWLIVQIEQPQGGAAGDSLMGVNVYFCQRTFLLHDQLFENACRIVDEQIRLVNQELLLEKMHQTEECDQLLLDHDSRQIGGQIGAGLDSVLRQSSAATRSAQNVPGEALSRPSSKFAQNRPSSLLLESEQQNEAPVKFRHTAAPNAAVVHARNNSLTFSDEEEHSEVSELARYKFRAGHFACQMVWHQWFPIHPRLKSCDSGFKALRLGLEGLAVRNRSNMYVYKEKGGNVVYMRLHCTEESVLANIPGNGGPWEEEVRQHCPQSILLAVHGVRPPGEEITVQLRSVLQRRLNSRTLEEIQNALLKNAHIRLEWNDIQFIQKDPSRPFSVFFFTIPQIAQRHLGSVKYYLSQQMLTFCISPKFREQSGAHHPFGRAKYSGGNSRYFSGGGTSLALSLAGTPTIEQQPQSQQFRMDSREMGPLHSFVPYSIPEMAQNPPNYSPTFYLVNKPPGEGKRDTGIACLEVKLIDWEGKLVEQTEEGRLDVESHSLLYPGVPAAIDPLQRMGRLHELSRCIQVENPLECAQMPGICAFFQFNMWQNGNVGVEELQGRLKMCVQQAVCDLVTEFGLLSCSLFDNSPTPVRSKAGSFSVASTSLQPIGGIKPCASELPIPHSEQAITPSNSVPLQASPVKALVAPPSQSSDCPNPLVKSEGISICHPQPLRHPVTVPLLNRAQRPLQSPVQFAAANPPPPQQKMLFHQESTGEMLRADFVIAADDWFSHVINETKGSPEMSHSVRKFQFRLDCDASAKKIIQIIHDRLKMVLKTERVVICKSTMHPEAALASRKRLQTIRSFTSLLDPTERDLGRRVSSNREVEGEPLELALLAFNEQFGQLEANHRGTQQPQQPEGGGIVPAAKIAEQTSPERGRLMSSNKAEGGNGPSEGRRATMMSQQREKEREKEGMDEEEEMRIWRNSMEPMQAFARRMSCVSSLGCWRAGAGSSHHLMLRSITPTPNESTANLPGGAGPPSPTARSSLSKFLPCLKPFIPRQRLLYLTIHGETVNLFLYNYTNEVVTKTREIVERATLWHNARSRLLREIGLHKMGITHLSTLKSEDANYNSYLLLTWMDPETLVNNDYPVDSLTTPDFSNIPRIYAQLLLKLYRFADPAFVAKHISLSPFEDQTQQMLALREDIRSMLNDHRLYMEVHQDLIDKRELTMSEELLGRLISHCHLVHFVQSPLLLLPSWRRKVAAIRGGTEFGVPCRKHSFQQIHQIQPSANGKTKNAKNQFSISTSASGSPHRYSTTEDEPCSGRIQQMLIEDYAHYLRSIGLSPLHIEKVPPDPSAAHLFAPITGGTRHPSGVPSALGSTPTPIQLAPSPPEQWLYFALDGGILFIQLSFISPYFCLRLLQWNAQPQLDEHLRPNQQKRGSGTHLDQQHSLRLLEHRKNELVRRCHLHSFVYDFHLRMVARYLVGEPHVLFNPGYNTNAFLVDFLQYYGCRPPNARNCVYEETIHCANLKVSQNAIWEHFLNNEQHFGWKVVRLKGQEGGGDEFMLVAKERRKAFGLDYELVRVVINWRGNGQPREHQIALRLYVLLVTEMTAPFESKAANGQPAESKSATDLQQFGGKDGKTFAPDGGEFTQILGRGGVGDQIEQMSPSSSGKIQIEQKNANASPIELESFGEEEEGEEDMGENAQMEAEECKVVDRQTEGGGGQSLLPSIFPPIHHRQHSASSTASQQSLSRRPPIFTPQMPQNCFECVIAAAAELEGKAGGWRGKGGRKRFCSGGMLLGGGSARRNVAARMSLPPSRTSTNSSSSSAQQKGERMRQRSDSSQLSMGSLVNSPTKGEGASTATKTLTPANSLKGLSEWRANQRGEGEGECPVDWTQLGDVEMERGRKSLAIQRNPPRRHRKGGQSQGNSFCLGMSDPIGREKGAIVPPEQVTYLHYLSSHQRRLQHLLEEEVRSNRLARFVQEADQFCHVDSLWKCLLASRPFQIPSQKAQSLFLSSTSSKSDILSEANFFGRHSIPSDLDHFDFEALLRVVGVESAAKKEPKLEKMLDRVNWPKLCRFLVQFFEPQKRCRFFECQPHSYLVLTNPQFLDSAAMFRHNLATECVEMFLLFKQSSPKFDAHLGSFASNSVQKLFEEVISCLCAFQWANLLQNPPNLA